MKDYFGEIGMQIKLVNLVEYLEDVCLAVAWTIPMDEKIALWESLDSALSMFLNRPKRRSLFEDFCFLVHIGSYRQCDKFSKKAKSSNDPFYSTLFTLNEDIDVRGTKVFDIEEYLYSFMRVLTETSTDTRDLVFKNVLIDNFGIDERIELDLIDSLMFELSPTSQRKLLEILAFIKTISDENEKLYSN